MYMFCVPDPDHVLVAGGIGRNSDARCGIYQLDLRTDTWQSLSSMAAPRYAAYSACLNNKLYVLGGLMIGTSVTGAFPHFTIKHGAR